jgi:hypothetical protein
MTTDFWKEALAKAKAERDEAYLAWDDFSEKAQTQLQRMVQLDETIRSLTVLVGETESPTNFLKGISAELTGKKLADACRLTLSYLDEYMTPLQMRDWLESAKYDLSGYANALAGIHGVLKRMVESGEVLQSKDSRERTVYRWNFTGNNPNPRAVVGSVRLRTVPTEEDAIKEVESKRKRAEAPAVDPDLIQSVFGKPKLTRRQLRLANEAERKARIDKEVE